MKEVMEKMEEIEQDAEELKEEHEDGEEDSEGDEELKEEHEDGEEDSEGDEDDLEWANISSSTTVNEYDKELGGDYIYWANISAHPNTKAVKPWVAKVTGYDPEYKYKWKQEFLDKDKAGGSRPYVDVSDLERGDIIRVSGASHSNDKTTCHLVLENTEDTFKTTRMLPKDVIEHLMS